MGMVHYVWVGVQHERGTSQIGWHVSSRSPLTGPSTDTYVRTIHTIQVSWRRFERWRSRSAAILGNQTPCRTRTATVPGSGADVDLESLLQRNVPVVSWWPTNTVDFGIAGRSQPPARSPAESLGEISLCLRDRFRVTTCGCRLIGRPAIHGPHITCYHRTCEQRRERERRQRRQRQRERQRRQQRRQQCKQYPAEPSTGPYSAYGASARQPPPTAVPRQKKKSTSSRQPAQP